MALIIYMTAKQQDKGDFESTKLTIGKPQPSFTCAHVFMCLCPILLNDLCRDRCLLFQPPFLSPCPFLQQHHTVELPFQNREANCSSIIQQLLLTTKYTQGELKIDSGFLTHKLSFCSQQNCYCKIEVEIKAYPLNNLFNFSCF